MITEESKARKALEEAMAPAWKAYKEAVAHARKAFDEAIAPYWKALEEARVHARKALEEAKDKERR